MISVDRHVWTTSLPLNMHKKQVGTLMCSDIKFADERARGNDHVLTLDVCLDLLAVYCTEEI